MRRYRFKKIDAFTDGRSPGNPAACVYPDNTSAIDGETMQRIAREMKGFVSEVAFLLREGEDMVLQYYSSTREVDFCGHATVAAMYDMIAGDADMRRKNQLSIRVKHERLAVFNRLERDNAVFIMAPSPRFSDVPAGEDEIARSLNANVEIISPGGTGCVNAGLSTLIVPVHSLEACLALSPDEHRLARFCEAAGVDIVLVYTRETFCAQQRYRTRVFAPRFGYLEDPATGSGNSAFGYYLLRRGEWAGGSCAIEQNGERDSPNIVLLDTAMQRGERRVLFGGPAVCRIDGWYCLHE